MALDIPTTSPALNNYAVAPTYGPTAPTTPTPGTGAATTNEAASYQPTLGRTATAAEAATMAAKPVSSLSSSNGSSTIDTHIANHQADINNLGSNAAPTKADTTPAPATSVDSSLKSQGGYSLDEVNASGMDTTNFKYDPKTKYFMPNTATPNGVDYSAEEARLTSQFDAATKGMDTASQNLVQSIKDIYAQRFADAQQINRGSLAAANAFNSAYGRYSPTSGIGVLSQAENDSMSRLGKLSSEEAGLIAQADQSLQDKKYAAFVQERTAISDLRKEKIGTLQKMKDDAYKAQQDTIKNNLDAKIHDDTVSYQEKQQAIAQATLDESVRKNKADELQKAADLKVKTDAAKLISGAMAAPVSATNGVVNPADQQKFLSSYSTDMQTAIKGVADYSIDPNSASKRVGAGISPLQLETIAKAYNPNYKAGNFKAVNSFLTSWASGGNNTVVQSANTVVQHFGELANYAEKLTNAPAGSLGPFTSVYNSTKQWLNENSQDPNVFQFKQTALYVASEMAKIMKNGSGSSAAPTTEEIRDQLSILTSNLSPQTAKAVISNGIQLMSDRLATARENYVNVVGAQPNPVLFPSALKTLGDLKQRGYDSIDTSALDPSPLAQTSDADLVTGITQPVTNGGADPSTYFNGIMSIINAPQPQ